MQRVLHIKFSKPQDVETICVLLERKAEVEYAEPVMMITSADSYIPDNLGANNYTGQWSLHRIQAPEARAISKGSRDIKVAVVDAGVDWHHPDLQAAMWINPGEIADNGIDDDGNGYIDDVRGYDVASNDSDPSPQAGETHGTHVAGLVAAKSDNGTGIASIGFDLSIIGVRCSFNNANSAFQGVVYAANAGAHIINCSWGGYGQPGITQSNAIDYALDKGCLIVTSTGNDGGDMLSYPAGHPGVISVGATNMADRMAAFSNYNEELSVCAPGYNIRSTYPNEHYQIISGTSMATPIVSGLLGLMKSYYPQITNDQLKELRPVQAG